MTISLRHEGSERRCKRYSNYCREITGIEENFKTIKKKLQKSKELGISKEEKRELRKKIKNKNSRLKDLNERLVPGLKKEMEENQNF
jgi:Skp family chaperone for outer membrane proteins